MSLERQSTSSDALVLHEKIYEEQKALAHKNYKIKVDIDVETKRVWQLLKKSVDNDGTGFDEEKNKWWENERQKLYALACSFIGSMRLVQGNRAFSPWKGSVVDSVVGVFLTQSVVDHSSSSTFMDIAAKYPNRYTSNKESMADKVTTPKLCNSTYIIDEVDDDDDTEIIHERIGGGQKKMRTEETMDIVDWDALRCTSLEEIGDLIRRRGFDKILSYRIKAFLNKVFRERDEIDLEWLRVAHPDQAKEYLRNIYGLGLKSVECVRLLSLHQPAFPVDINVARIVVRLGWVPLQQLPDELQMHLLEKYPSANSIQKYLWPRLCKLDQKTLYELHYHLITFGKVFFTKVEPNCMACPMKAQCAYYASANHGRSGHRALLEIEYRKEAAVMIHERFSNPISLMIHQRPEVTEEEQKKYGNNEPIIEEPASPELELADIEDCPDPCINGDTIPTLFLNKEVIGTSTHMVVPRLHPTLFPTREQKVIERLRTEHYVYELPDDHPILKGFVKREPEDINSKFYYLLAIWTPDEKANSKNLKTVRGTILIPCRTAMKGGFPLNGTFFQTNEVFADHYSSKNPIHIRRDSIKNLKRCVLFCGSSVSSCFKELSLEPIQESFWEGYVCIRGFDRKSRKPKDLVKKLLYKSNKKKSNKKKKDEP